MGRSFILPLIVAGTIFATGSRIKAFQLIMPESLAYRLASSTSRGVTFPAPRLKC